MSDTAVEFDRVWKKFRKGEIHDSLRDLIPAITRNFFSGNHKRELDEQEFWALKDVSFQVKRGEVLGIIGPNGAGKSTVLKLLSKIMVPNKGRLQVHGRLSALIEVGAGFHPDLTGRENVYLNGAILGMRRQEIEKKFDEIVEFSGIGDFIDTPVKRYSSGMYARLGFSVAAHVSPEVLLVDEVLSVGDYSFQTKCLKRMQEISVSGTTIIFISHNIPSVIRLCPNAILLNKGVIEKTGPSQDVCRFYHHAYAEAHRASNTIRLERLELLSRDGSARNAFGTCEWAKARLTLTSQKAVEGLYMGFLVKREDGLMIFDANSDKVADTYFSFGAGEKRSVMVNFRLNLPAGTYFLGVHFHKDAEGFYFYDDELMKFHVAGPKTLGYAFLDTRWE